MKNFESRIFSLEKLLKSKKEKDKVVIIYFDMDKKKSTEIKILDRTYTILPDEDPNAYIENNLKSFLAEKYVCLYKPFKRGLSPPPENLIAKISNNN